MYQRQPPDLIESQLLSLATIFAVASAAGEGFVVTYELTNCVQASLPAGGLTSLTNTELPQNVCAKLKNFLSFQGGSGLPCATGQTPEVLAYRSDDCSGSGISAGSLPADNEPGACQDIVAGDIGSGVRVGGQSAKFICVAA